MKVRHCDLCGEEMKEKDQIFILEHRGKKFRIAVQVHTGNGRWAHIWKNVDCCSVCYKKHWGYHGKEC